MMMKMTGEGGKGATATRELVNRRPAVRREGEGRDDDVDDNKGSLGLGD